MGKGGGEVGVKVVLENNPENGIIFLFKLISKITLGY